MSGIVKYRSATSKQKYAVRSRSQGTGDKDSAFKTRGLKKQISHWEYLSALKNHSIWLFIFQASCLGEHLVCSPCGDLAVSFVSSLELRGPVPEVLLSRLPWKDRIIP